MNENSLNEEDIFELILESSKKEITLDSLSKNIGLSTLETLGYITKLQKIDKGLIISKKDKGITIINNGDLYYEVKDDVILSTNEFGEKKIMLISDPRFGSVFSQKKFLNESYLRAYNEGYDTVFLLGNVTEGLYNISSQSDYYRDLYAQDTMKQVEDVINNYPYVEGINTYFIIGPKDKKHLTSKKINIGKLIAETREDMLFLGTNRAKIYVDNVSIILQNLALAKTYTTSYRPEQAIKAIRSEDKPDILIYGGLCQLETFNYRDIEEISVPSLVATTTEMNSKRYDNVIGVQFITIKTNRFGKLKDIDYCDQVLYNSSENDYSTVKTLKLTKGGKYNAR